MKATIPTIEEQNAPESNPQNAYLIQLDKEINSLQEEYRKSVENSAVILRKIEDRKKLYSAIVEISKETRYERTPVRVVKSIAFLSDRAYIRWVNEMDEFFGIAENVNVKFSTYQIYDKINNGRFDENKRHIHIMALLNTLNKFVADGKLKTATVGKMKVFWRELGQ